MSVYMVQSSLNCPDGPAVSAVSTSACLCEGVNVSERKGKGKKKTTACFLLSESEPEKEGGPFLQLDLKKKNPPTHP